MGYQTKRIIDMIKRGAGEIPTKEERERIVKEYWQQMRDEENNQETTENLLIQQRALLERGEKENETVATRNIPHESASSIHDAERSFGSISPSDSPDVMSIPFDSPMENNEQSSGVSMDDSGRWRFTDSNDMNRDEDLDFKNKDLQV